MAISFVGQAVGTTTATIPAHVAGDMIIALAFRSGSTTQATMPAGWTSVQTSATQTAASRLAYRIATAAGTTTGTWSNASRLVVIVLRGTGGIGAAPVPLNGFSTSVTCAILDPTFKDGTSWGLRIPAHRTSTGLTAPAGLTQRAITSGNPIAGIWSVTAPLTGNISTAVLPGFSGTEGSPRDPGRLTRTARRARPDTASRTVHVPRRGANAGAA